MTNGPGANAKRVDAIASMIWLLESAAARTCEVSRNGIGRGTKEVTAKHRVFTPDTDNTGNPHRAGTYTTKTA